MSELFFGPDNKPRCPWVSAAPDFLHYHDHEWGFPIGDDRRLFEKLCLESFQSGLSWRTILAKRENFRAAFRHFDWQQIAEFNEKDVQRLLRDEGIVRNRRKIEAVINNACRAQEMIEREGSLAGYFWRYEARGDQLVAPQTVTQSEQSVALAKSLKKQGWKFLGPTTVFAFFQSMGFINDHLKGCCVREEIERARVVFKRPT